MGNKHKRRGKHQIFLFARKRLKKFHGDIEFSSRGEVFRSYRDTFGSDPETDYNVRKARKLTEPKVVVPKEGFVYFAGSTTYNFVKIGFSEDPEARLKSIQTGCPFKLFILKVVKGTMEMERSFHETFKEHKTYGEWFRIKDELEKFLEC